MHAVAEHRGHEAVVLGAVGDDDGRFGGGVGLDPVGDEPVDLDDGAVLEWEGDNLVNLL